MLFGKDKSTFDKINDYLIKRGHELVMSIYLSNYNGNNIYIRFDYVRKLAVYKIVWVDLNYFNPKHIEDYLSMQLVTKFLSLKIVERMMEVKQESGYSFNDNIIGDRVEILTYFNNAPKEYIFDRFIPLEWDFLIDPLAMIFSYLPRSMEVFLNEMFGKFDGLEEKYNYLKPVKFDLNNGDVKELFKDKYITKGKKLFEDGKVKYLEKLENKFKTKGYTIDEPNVILNPYENSPLTALVLFETKKNVTPKVTIVGKDEHSTFTHTFEKGKKHYLPIYGLYADYENEVIIEYQEGDNTVTKTINIKTDKLSDNMILPTRVYADKEVLGNELYFYTPSSAGYTCAYDINGDVRWYFTNYALWKIDRLENGHLLVSTERLVNSPYYMTGLYEMDLLGKIYTEYSMQGGYHHDYYELENGNLLVASNDFNNEDGTVEDYIIELDRVTGNIVKTFDLKDILNMKDGQSENWSTYDWFHNNSVWYDKDTNSITLSGRHQDAVINIDYDSGDFYSFI